MEINRMPLTAALVLAAVLLAAAVAGAGDPALFYDFERIEDDRLVDLSGNGYHGRLHGEYERVPGGVRFIDARAEVPAVEEMNVGEEGFFFEMVLEIEKDIPFTYNGAVIPLTADYAERHRAWEISIMEDGYLRFNVRNPTGSYSAAGSSEPLPAGKPVHIVCALEDCGMWDTKMRVVYVNGRRQPYVQRGSAAKMEDIEKITVGAQEADTRQFRGIIRELRLYGRPFAGEDDPAMARGREYAEDE